MCGAGVSKAGSVGKTLSARECAGSEAEVESAVLLSSRLGTRG